MYFLLLLFWLRGDIVSGLIWAGVVTVSILVHELGHATVASYYRLSPAILLHGLGGLCFHQRARRDLHDAFIIAAGPGAGLLLGALTFVVWLVMPPTTPRVAEAFEMMLWVNVVWSFVNLLPLWPLDGGQLFRLGLIQFLKPPTAEKITHWVSLVLLIGLISWSLWAKEIFGVVLCALGIWQNIRALRGEIQSGTYRPPASKEADTLLAQAKQAYARNDYREAARLCHLIRGINNVSELTLKQTWGILGPATARMGDHQAALHMLERAVETPDVVEAKIECLFQLDRMAELEELLDSPAFRRLSPARQSEILAVVRAA